jgi:hypothetical protein
MRDFRQDRTTVVASTYRSLSSEREPQAQAPPTNPQSRIPNPQSKDWCRLALYKDSPQPRSVQPKPSEDAEVIAIPRVGGIHHRYEWRKAA